ncbi:MAG: hypothetical protein MR029_02785 [Clostridium sp.]|nr:hypothetical protein [Clostridium sp.]
MNKARWKKATAFAMASIMMLSMAACGKKTKDSSSKKEKENKKEMTFQSEDLKIDGVKGDINTCVVSGDRIYFYTMEWDESKTEGETPEESTSEEASGEEDLTEAGSTEEGTSEEATGEETASEEETTEVPSGEETSEEGASEEVTGEPSDAAKYYLYSIKADGTDLQELGQLDIDTNSYINYLLISKDGGIHLVIGAYDEKSQKSSYEIASVDENGKITDKQDITDLLGLTDQNYLSKAMMDSKDRYVFTTDQNIIVVDQSLKKICEMKPESSYVESIAITKDGDIVVGDSSGDDGAKVQVLDVEKQKWGDTYKMDFNYFNNGDALMNGSGDYDFYYKDDSGIYGYQLASKKGTKLMDFVASNVTSDASYFILPIDAETMIGTSWQDSGSKLTLYKKVDPSSIKDKTTITVGAMYLDDNVKRAAIDFNKKNDQYQVELKDYSSEEDPETKMNADIIAGNVPDIICLNGVSVDQYAEKGILEDLSTFYEKDQDISKDDLIPSVEKAMEIDGKLYFVSPSFTISTLIASAKDVGTESGWTMDDLKKLLKEKSDARPFYSENKNDTLYSFIASNINDFVDWSTGECSFDSQDFKDILEISNQGKNEEMDYSEDSPSEPSLVKSGKVLFTSGFGVDMESVELYEKMYNGDITFIGYPNKDKNGSYFSFDMPMGIYSKSKVKDAAWEFVKMFMSLEFQGGQDTIYSNPTRQDAFDMLVKRKTATKKYKDELGNEVEPLQSGYGWDDLNIDIGPLSDEQAQKYIDLVNSTTKTSDYNTEITNIITEEAKAYFAGQKSLDETADIIQNRVKTYVNENR